MPVAIITGASSGIGAATASRMAAAGWKIAIVGRRRARLESLASAGEAGGVLAVEADLTQAGALAAAVARLQAWQPRADALIHAAGDFFAAPMSTTTSAEFERLWRLTVAARFALTRDLLPMLTPAAGAYSAVVHVASLAVHRDFADETAYMSAMYGVLGLARAQDAELRPQRIRVSVVSPGLVRTELTERGPFAAADLARALPPEALAATIVNLVETLRGGGYIPEILQTPSALDSL